jgi:hypothetical protein
MNALLSRKPFDKAARLSPAEQIFSGFRFCPGLKMRENDLTEPQHTGASPIEETIFLDHKEIPMSYTAHALPPSGVTKPELKTRQENAHEYHF